MTCAIFWRMLRLSMRLRPACRPVSSALRLRAASIGGITLRRGMAEQVVVDTTATIENVLEGKAQNNTPRKKPKPTVPISPVLVKWAAASETEVLTELKRSIEEIAIGPVTVDSLFTDFSLKAKLLDSLIPTFGVQILSKDLGSIRSAADLARYITTTIKKQHDVEVARTALADPLPSNLQMLDYKYDVRKKPKRPSLMRDRWWLKTNTPHLQWTASGGKPSATATEAAAN